MLRPEGRDPSWGAYIRLLRPRQWTKNGFVFAGLIFSGLASNPAAGARALLAFAAFCAVASSVYVVNDILDRDSDRLHPVKRHRPIASGAVMPRIGILLTVVLLLAASAFGALAGPSVLALLACYLTLNVAYTVWLKHVVVLDVMVIATGFILRILAGTEAVNVTASAWIVMCTFFLALFLGFGKRRAEMNAMSSDATRTRAVLSAYNIPMLDRFSNISGTLALSAYALFTMAPGHNQALMMTCPIVVFCLFRYLYLLEQCGAGEAPDEILLTDRQIQIAVMMWLALCVSILYFGVTVNIR